MQHVAKERLGGDLIVGILHKHGRTCKSEEQCPWKGVFDVDEHLAKHAAVTLVYDKHQPFLSDLLDGLSRNHLRGLDVRHLLDRGHDQTVILVRTGQLAHEHHGVLRILNVVILSRKTTVFIQRLDAQLHPVEQEHHLVGIP